MADQSRQVRQTLYGDSAPTSRNAVKVLTAATIGAGLSFLSGLTLTGTVIGLIVVTPLLVLCSPVLVPAAIALFLTFAGFVFSGGCGAVGISVLMWIYQYVAGKHPPGADQLDQGKEKLATKAREMKEKARGYGQQVQQKAQETTQGS
ncbi:oleosin 1-like [Tripterygium wilfordii]|uniref:Oleosin 1-like n=1 Tax=Tripterygium wilfordii TaxID=458696 RepID=A0A7J7DAD7_TRIWF|nr:oleosin 1-like [Tripterygium wilfordii]KAF5743218.1 oleosin 1-like [Tripterygium wilfordii]